MTPTASTLIWKPTQRQEDFACLPDSILEALYGGAAGGGKSDLLMMLPIIRKFNEHPKFKGLLLRRTFPELESEIIVRSQETYKHTGASYNEQKKRWTWPSGAIMQFGHMEHEKDVRNYDTAQYNLIMFDELTSFTEFQYRYMVSRCRSAAADLPAIMRSGSNPGNVGHGFVRDRFVAPCKEGYKIIRDKTTNTSRIFIPSKVTDNPYVLKANPNYINNLNILPESERLAKRDGDWWTFTGQVFTDFRVVRLSDEPENALHVIPSFDIPHYWPTILFVDWGFSAMMYAGWISINPSTKQLFVKREFSCKKTLISSWASQIKNLSRSDWLIDVVLDPSAWQNRGDEKNIAAQFTDFFGREPRKADNDRIAGKMLIQELLRWRPYENINTEEFDPKLANIIMEVSGMDRYKEYVNSFKPLDINQNLPRILIFEENKVLIDALAKCVYTSSLKVRANKEDVAEFEGDDPYDALRYGVLAAQHYLESGLDEVKYQAKLSEIISSYKSTRDMTELHIKMVSMKRPDKIQCFRSRRRRNPNLTFGRR